MNKELTLRKTLESDLEILFENQLDEEANYMAAFTSEDPTDKAAYMAKWTAILKNTSVDMQTICIGSDIAGSVLSYEMFGGLQVSYWIKKELWGNGIASHALRKFLSIVETRPLFGRVASDNTRSQKVLENCGFIAINRERGYANARRMEIEEIVYRLDNENVQ